MVPSVFIPDLFQAVMSNEFPCAGATLPTPDLLFWLSSAGDPNGIYCSLIKVGGEARIPLSLCGSFRRLPGTDGVRGSLVRFPLLKWQRAKPCSFGPGMPCLLSLICCRRLGRLQRPPGIILCLIEGSG